MSAASGPSPAQAALAALRERFRASATNTFQAFERMAAQLALTPDAGEVVDALRRELHRVHGTAGSYGYMEASRLAAKVEERAIRWTRDPELDREQRGTIVQHFVGALRLAFDQDDAPGADAPAARRRIALVGLDDAWRSALRIEGVLHRWGLEHLTAEECTGARVRELAPHVLITRVELVPRLAAEASASGVPIIALDDRPRGRRAPLEDAGVGNVMLLDAGTDVATIVDLVERLSLRSTNAGAAILVVDDDPSILAIARYLVEADGTRVVTLDDPTRLHEVLAELRPSLLLMDVQMHEHNGIALVRALRAVPEWRDLPVILFSTEVHAHVRQEAYDAGADEFIPKPIVPPELRARIRSRLERHRLQRLAEGLHPGTGLPLPARSARDAASFIDQAAEAGRACAVALLRPAAPSGEGEEAVAWLHECQRLSVALAPDAFVGFHEGVGLLVVVAEEAGNLAGRLELLSSGVGNGRWTAGVAGSSDVGMREFPVLRRAAEDALELAHATGTAIARWSRDAADVAPDVIIVEDDRALADMLQFALRSAGYSFRAYHTGPEALDALLAMKTLGRRPLVLLDIDLPGMDGHSLHERLRTERPSAYKVVFITVHGAEGEQIRALKAGALDWVVKPLSMRVLMAKVPLWLGRAGRG